MKKLLMAGILALAIIPVAVVLTACGAAGQLRGTWNNAAGDNLVLQSSTFTWGDMTGSWSFTTDADVRVAGIRSIVGTMTLNPTGGERTEFHFMFMGRGSDRMLTLSTDSDDHFFTQGNPIG